MAKVVVLGGSGMLGHVVAHYLRSMSDYEVWTSYRNINYRQENSFLLDAQDEYIDEDFPKADYVINCIGIIKPHMEGNTRDAILVNSLFPHKLATLCHTHGSKLIHITTDCVYSGRIGNYTENYLHDALDAYGKTKSLGEPKNSMVIRTSIIGEEQGTSHSLLEWAKSSRGQRINGFTNHIWNGITTLQYAKICNQIMRDELFEHDTFHVFSDTVTKYELLEQISERFNLGLDIMPTTSDAYCNRALATQKSLMPILEIPSINTQLKEAANA